MTCSTANAARPVITALICLTFCGCGSQPALPPATESKVQCRSPNKPSAQPTAVAQWKFNVIQKTVLSILTDGGPISPRSLPERVADVLTEVEIERLGNLNWLVEKVRLEMEVRGEIERTTLPTGQFVLHLPGDERPATVGVNGQKTQSERNKTDWVQGPHGRSFPGRPYHVLSVAFACRTSLGAELP